MATVDELNADFVEAYNDLHDFVLSSVPDTSYPFVGNVRQMALQKLQSPQGRAAILNIVKKLIAADEAWRAAHPSTPGA